MCGVWCICLRISRRLYVHLNLLELQEKKAERDENTIRLQFMKDEKKKKKEKKRKSAETSQVGGRKKEKQERKTPRKKS